MSDPLDRILVVVAHCPSPATSNDGQANYLLRAADALHSETGAQIDVVTLRLEDQLPAEDVGCLSIRRLEPPSPIARLYDLYEPPVFGEAVRALADGVSHIASTLGPDVPAWCHGYETGSALERLRNLGHGVVGVLHYSVAQDIAHALELPERPPGTSTWSRRLADAARRLCRPSVRPALIRACARFAPQLRRVTRTSTRAVLERLEQEAALIASAHCVVAVSPEFGASLEVLHAGTPIDLRSCTPGAPAAGCSSMGRWPFPQRPDRLRLAMVGRPARQKGWHYLARALHDLERDQPERAERLDLVAIGGIGSWRGDYGAEVLASFSALRRVAFSDAGELPHDEVMQLLGAADVLVLPSIFEPFGLVLLEAMSAGCLVIAADADGPRGVVRRPWGTLMPFGEPRERVAALATAIDRTLALSREELAQRAAAARAAAAEYRWTDCARVHARALSDACSKASAIRGAR